MALTDDTRIILIHGLASKPAKETLHELWCRALIESVGVDSTKLARAMKANKDLFESAYWANEIPDHIEDSAYYVKSMRSCVDDVIKLRRTKKNDLHIGAGGWVKSKLKSFGLSIVDTLGRAVTIKDNVIDEHMNEVHLYQSDQYTADKVRAPLEDALRRAWDEGKRVMIISHSMGTFISYDVLWRFTHRSEDRYRQYRSKTVEMLITMGSPLGDETLRDFMLVERWRDSTGAKRKTDRQRYYPGNIEQWHNYSAYGDVVCHDSDLEDDFFKAMRKDVRDYKPGALRDYEKLYNPYVNAEGTNNPHKSYGYLIQPKLSQNMLRFFGLA